MRLAGYSQAQLQRAAVAQMLMTQGRHSAILGTSPELLEFYYPLDETTGTTAVDASGKGRNGTHVGATLGAYTTPFSRPAPLFDAVTDYVDIYSSSLASALATWSEGTVVAFVRVSGAGVWTDGVARSILQISDSAQGNRVNLWKYSVSNQVRFQRVVGGVSVQIFATITPTADVICLGMSWSVANNRLRGWVSYRGVPAAQIGSTQTGVTAWSAVTHANTRCLIGNTYTVTPTNLIDGNVFEVAGWSSEFDLTQLASVMAF